MKTKIILIFTILSFYGLHAQQNLDSLYGIWQDTKNSDSTRVIAFKGYIWNGFLYSQPDSALILSEALHRFAKEKEYPYAASLGFSLQGIAYDVQGKFTLSIDCHEKAMTIKEEIGDEIGISATLSNMGNVYGYQGNFSRALEYHDKSLAIAEKIGNKRMIASCMLNTGIIKEQQGNYIHALNYYEKALVLSEEIDDKQIISYTLNNIGIIYKFLGDYIRTLEYYEKSLKIKEEIGYKNAISATLSNIGTLHSDLGNYSTALKYLEKALVMDEEIGDKQGIATSLTNIGNVFFYQGNFTQALDYHKKALTISEVIGDKDNMVISFNNMGRMYADQGNAVLGLEYCAKGLVLAKEIEQLDNQIKACECLYSNYKTLGNSQKALVYHEKMLILNDSLKLQETSKKLQQMEFAKQVLADSLQQVEKDLQVEMAHQAEVRTKDRNRNLAIGAGIFFLVLSGGYYSRWRYVKKSKQIIEKEKDRSENLLLNILPHEIAEELKLKGSVDAQDFDQVSVLFTDFQGFTSRSEKLSARELVNEINQCFEAFDHICEKYKIEKIKTIGDAYMAGGGLPVPSEGAVKNTVLAALEMQAFMANRITEKKAKDEIPFEMRLGIHTGPVVAGIVGVKKFQYDIWGDTVNTASRMESSGQVGKVNISQDTYEIIKDDPQFSFTARGKIKAKGKGEIEMFFVGQSA